MGPALTPSQTVGPFFHDSLLRHEATNVVAASDATGARIRIEGRVFDGNGDGVADAMVELWQANVHGRYHHPADQRDLPLDDGFTGFGRAGTDADGAFWFETVRPGPVPAPDGGLQAPHLLMQVFARGLLDHLTTRVYFAGEAANDGDAVLQSVPPPRRSTLIARLEDRAATPVYWFDVRLQGADETVFFDV